MIVGWYSEKVPQEGRGIKSRGRGTNLRDPMVQESEEKEGGG